LLFIGDRGRIELPTPCFLDMGKLMFMNTFFVLGAVALLSLLAFYWKGKISTSFMTTGVLVIVFIFSFLSVK
jgi:hypothetical protein